MATLIELQDEAFKEQLRALVQRYAANRAEYIRRDSDYNETEVRTDYIDELFKSLGWDINNTQGLSPLAQEVRRERGPTRGEPDYTFRINSGGVAATPVFFLEAKSPKESLDNPNHVFQAKSYAFSAAQSSLVLVLLTNFEKFRLYLVEDEPALTDAPEKHLVFDWSYEELESKADELQLFNKTKVQNGSLTKLGRHGIPVTMRPPVETPFLQKLDQVREALAKGFYNSNRGLSERELNLLTDLVVNRIVFIRFAEDRNILPQEDLKQVVRQWEYRKSESLLSSVETYFKELNRRFNGRMFADEISLSDYEISDNVLCEVIQGFYPPNCPYRFDQIRVELLGEIYEKYLGKVIVRKGRGVTVEEKPEVRHAKGVYYTPDYIVDEVLKYCLLPKLESASSIEAIFELRGIDPACGSGTFLLGAYRLISSFIFSKAMATEVSRQRYLELVENNWKIKYQVKRNILEYCLNGVDIDPRAIRVSELSLYLKLLEDEPDISRNPIPYLPSLSKNLQFGNSLIDASMLPQEELGLEDSILNRVAPFTWETDETFGPIMKQGGFDWIMGNPPYIRMQVLRKFSGIETDIIQENYAELAQGNPDIYAAFFVRGTAKLKKDGLLGFIVSNKFMVTDYGAPIRKLLTDNYYVPYLVDFGHQQVFVGATTHTCIIVVEKRSSAETSLIKEVDTTPCAQVFAENATGVSVRQHSLKDLGDKPWQWHSKSIGDTSVGFQALDKICEIFQGIRTSDNDVFVLRKARSEGKRIIGFSNALDREVELEAEICRPFLKGRDIGRNWHTPISQALIFPYQTDDAYKLIPFTQLKAKYPKAAAYLKACQKQLRDREDGDFDQKNWYGYLYLKNHDLMAMPKVMIQEMAPRAHLTFDSKGTKFFVSGYGLYIKSRADRSPEHYRFLQAILKTERIDDKVVSVASKIKAGYQYRKQYLKDLPVPTFNSQNQVHLSIAASQELVEVLAAQLSAAPSAVAKRELNARIDIHEKEIEMMVGTLYEGKQASSKDIEKVQEIVARIECLIADIRARSRSRRSKLRKQA